MTSFPELPPKPLILILCNYYLPGYKGGGGLRTIVHMVERFRDRFDFHVITRDCDSDGTIHPDIRADEWNQVEGAEVFYLSKKRISLRNLRRLIVEIAPDSIYLNSFFSTLTVRYLILRKLKLIPPIKTILAPEGELSVGALGLKSYKKRPYLRLTKWMGLYQNLIWKTTHEFEKQESLKIKGDGGEIYIAPNLPSTKLGQDFDPKWKPAKNVGAVKMIFLSRYAKKKNFKWIVDNLQGIEGELVIDVYGPLEDRKYWEDTEKVIARLPENIQINYRGLLEYEQVFRRLSDYHFFILPTMGENFGHVFIEALAAGCPLLISDRTPWINLEEKNIGWDLPLEQPEKWRNKLNQCIKMNQASYSLLSNNARQYAVRWIVDPEHLEDTLRVLQNSLDSKLDNIR